MHYLTIKCRCLVIFDLLKPSHKFPFFQKKDGKVSCFHLSQ